MAPDQEPDQEAAAVEPGFEGFERSVLDTGDTRILAMRGGSGPPLLLLHGNPQTHLMWHHVAGRLAEDFTVVATDLRGYGDSGKPAGGGDHSAHSKRVMANDQVEVMRQLGYERFFVAGHDRGGRCGYRMAIDHPDRVLRLAVLDIVPTIEAYRRADMAFGLGYWHWFFLPQPYDFPERMIGAAPEAFFNRQGSWEPASAFPPAVVAEYLRHLRDPATIHGICEDYRAGATIDLTYDEADRGGLPIRCPLLVLWGAKGALPAWYDVLGVWRDWAEDVRGHEIDAGHYLAEEAPEATYDALHAFFNRARPGSRGDTIMRLDP